MLDVIVILSMAFQNSTPMLDVIVILSMAFQNSTSMLDVQTLSAVRDRLENFTKSVSLAGGRNMHANGRKDMYTDMITQPVSFR